MFSWQPVISAVVAWTSHRLWKLMSWSCSLKNAVHMVQIRPVGYSLQIPGMDVHSIYFIKVSFTCQDWPQAAISRGSRIHIRDGFFSLSHSGWQLWLKHCTNNVCIMKVTPSFSQNSTPCSITLRTIHLLWMGIGIVIIFPILLQIEAEILSRPLITGLIMDEAYYMLK